MKKKRLFRDLWGCFLFSLTPNPRDPPPPKKRGGLGAKKGQLGEKIRREMRGYVGKGANERRFGVKKGHLGQK